MASNGDCTLIKIVGAVEAHEYLPLRIIPRLVEMSTNYTPRNCPCRLFEEQKNFEVDQLGSKYCIEDNEKLVVLIKKRFQGGEFESITEKLGNSKNKIVRVELRVEFHRLDFEEQMNFYDKFIESFDELCAKNAEAKNQANKVIGR